MKIPALLAAILLVATTHGMAQPVTGIFDSTITYMNEARTLSFYVPADYDSTRKYALMVCLHGSGDTSTNYRSVLAEAWPAIFPNTIIVCPDGGSDQSSDFYAPAGDEGIIPATITYAMARYSIDTAAVTLQGFSLGGRSALKYGLEHPDMFKGLLLSTPAIQGISDMLNDPALGFGFNYDNASRIPIFLTVGADDGTYLSIIGETVTRLKKANAPLYYTVVTGMGHQPAPNTVNGLYREFAESPTVGDYDLDLFDIDMPTYSCNGVVSATCYVRNTGAADVTSFTLILNVDGKTDSTVWTGTLKPYEHAAVQVSLTTDMVDVHATSVTAGRVNVSQIDPDAANNFSTGAIELASDGGLTESIEDFETGVSWWPMPTGSPFGWSLTNSAAKSGQLSLLSFNTIQLFYTNGYRESITSSFVDVSALKNRTFSYDYAYNYVKYTPPYFTQDVEFADTLEIGISTDCGETYQTLLRTSGAAMATAAQPLLNPLTLEASFYTPTAQEWKHVSLDLSAYASSTNAIIKVSIISGMGGTTYMDNLAFGEAASDVAMPVTEQLGFSVYPNPASGEFTVGLPQVADGTVRIYDQTGRMVLEQVLHGNTSDAVRIATGTLASGCYRVEVAAGNARGIQTLIVNN